MTIHLSDIPASIRRAMGEEIPTKPPRAARGTLKAERVANHAARLKIALQIFGGTELPEGVSVRENPGAMNKWERAFINNLEAERAVAERGDCKFAPLAYAFGIVRFELGGGAKYTPDVPVRMRDGRVVIFEVKGSRFVERVSHFKIARHLYPQFRWKIVEKIGGGWREKKINDGSRPQRKT